MTATSCPAEKTDLGRKLGPGAVLALGIGTTVGSGIFSSLSEVAGAAGSSLFPVLASACLEDGGQYVYFREAGPPVLLLYVGEAEPEGSLIPA